MRRFIDRELERGTLEREYGREGASLVIVYGRRRVGKTALLTEFIQGKPALYFLATQESEAINRSAFREKVAAFTGNPLLMDVSVTKWDPLFQAVISQDFHAKPVIVMDEFQYLGKSNPAFSSILQRIWDELLKDSSLMLILCGSLTSMMVSQTLSYNSPLYGRRTAQIRLKQLEAIFPSCARSHSGTANCRIWPPPWRQRRRI